MEYSANNPVGSRAVLSYGKLMLLVPQSERNILNVIVEFPVEFSFAVLIGVAAGVLLFWGDRIAGKYCWFIKVGTMVNWLSELTYRRDKKEEQVDPPIEYLLKVHLESSGRHTNAVNEKGARVDKKIKEAIHDHFQDPELSIPRLSMILTMSRSTLYRNWKKYNEPTINEYITRVRLIYANHLMIEEQQSICEAALASGFNSHSYFSKVYKKCYGITPMEFIRNNMP